MYVHASLDVPKWPENMLQPFPISDEKETQKDKLRILVLCMHVYPAYVAGAEIHAYYVSNKLAENGHYVHVIAIATRKQVETQVRIMFKQSSVRLWRPPFSGLAYVIKVFLLAYLRRCEFDVIQVHIATGMTMLPAFMISKIAGKPYVVTCHGSEIRIFPKKAFSKLLQKILLLKASHVVAVSMDIRDLLLKEYGLSSRKIKIVPNGYDEELVNQLRTIASNSVCGKIPSLVFVGTLREAKDPLNLIEAFRIVSGRVENVRLQIVGDGTLRPAVERKIESYKMQDRVTLHGAVSHERALEVLASSDIYVLTSVDEGLPISLIEAMALGKAVVATSVGGVPEIVIDGVNGMLTPPRLPGRIAQSIERLLEDPVLTERLRKAAAESVRDFSWSNIAQKYQNIYREVRRPKSQRCVERPNSL
jgi:glycosyltransferase involved in cell wall biosynthesis